MTADELAAAVGAAAAHELDSALLRIEHCLGQLNDEQVWRRSRPGLNIIGNLILHLSGNLRQWIVAGLGDAPDPADDRPTIRNPGFVVVIGEERVVSRPEFERVDFLVTRESPGEAGRILLG
jgi:hypothetical protein